MAGGEMMRLVGLTGEQMMQELALMAPGAVRAVETADILASGSSKKRVYEYQAAALYLLAQKANRAGAQILEIGTYYGFTAAVMGLAAPEAQVTTLNPTTWEYETAKKNLRLLGNVACKCRYSWEYLEEYMGPELDLIFVDGNHVKISKDLEWWAWVKQGGMMVFHDYSPAESHRPCTPVFEGLNKFREKLGRNFDILVVDDGLAGMAGFVKREGE